MSESIHYVSPDKLTRQWSTTERDENPVFPTWAETIIDCSSFGLKDGRMVKSSFSLAEWRRLFGSSRQLDEFLFEYLVMQRSSAERFQKLTWYRLFVEKPNVFEAFIRRDSVRASRSIGYFEAPEEHRSAIALLAACVPDEDSGIASRYKPVWAEDLAATVRLMMNGLRPQHVTRALESGMDADLMNALVASN
jgi:hypothetical protein